MVFLISVQILNGDAESVTGNGPGSWASAANPEQAAQAQNNPKVIGWFVGQVMKATKGQANPGVVNEVLRKKLGG